MKPIRIVIGGTRFDRAGMSGLYAVATSTASRSGWVAEGGIGGTYCFPETED